MAVGLRKCSWREQHPQVFAAAIDADIRKSLHAVWGKDLNTWPYLSLDVTVS
jgi:hypothetical protein